jgi:hypothetical protein
MEYTYEVIENFGENVIKRTDQEGNQAFIPTDPANTDYQEYLVSIEATEPKAK